MRLERLDLTRYGKFNDHSLDFGPPRAGKPDLHIIHGPNEAGKTTTLNAWLDLLYGMPPTTAYAWQHGYDMMRIGARLALADGVRDYVRIKRAKNSLLDAEGRPVSDEPLVQAMAGLNRAAYANMFSLDVAALEAGGKEAAESRGQLGEMLFSASAGLGTLSGKLAGLRAQADVFWKPRARNTHLAKLKSELLELRQKRDDIDTIAARFSALTADLARSSALYEEAVARRGALEKRRDEIRRALTGLDLAPRLASLRARLAELPDVADAPPEWAEQTTALLRDEVELGVLLQTQREAQETTLQKRGAIVVDDAAMDLEPQLRALEALHSRHVTASSDIPKLRHEMEASTHAIAALLRQIDRPSESEPSRLLLPARIVQTLRDLADQKTGIDARLEAARREHAGALAQSEAARGGASADGPAKTPDAAPNEAPDEALMAQLTATADAMRQGDLDQRLARAQRSVDAASAVLAQRMEALAPWSGEAAVLAAMAPPAASRLDALHNERRRLMREAETLAESAATLDRDISVIAAELAGLASVTGLADEAEVARARSAREQAWASHRRALDLTTADMFEAALRHDDMVGEARLTRQKEMLRVAQLRQQLESLRSRRAELALRQQAHTAQAATVPEATRALAVTLSPRLGSLEAPDALADWLERRQHALNAREPLLGAQQEHETAASLRSEAIQRLARLLAQAGVTAIDTSGRDADALQELLAAADKLRTSIAAQRRQREDITRAAEALKDRERALAHEQDAAAAWIAEWSVACKSCWLGEQAALPSPADVRASLDALARLETELSRLEGLASRIGKMERDQQQFATLVRQLAAQHAGDDDSADTEDADAQVLHRALVSKATAATEALKRRQELDAALEQTQTNLLGLEERQAVLNAHTSRITAHFRVETLSEATEALRASQERRLLTGQIRELEEQIVATTGAATIADADSQLAGVDRGALTAEAAGLEAQVADTDMRSRELFAQRARIEEEIAVIGADASAAQLESQRQTVLLEIEDSARTYLKLRLGVAAADQALSVWRDSHRSTLLANASRAFSQMSCGAWGGLTAQPGGDGEVLVAVLPDGAMRNVAALSKGTRFQLYLALRIAAFHEFAATRTPPPFITDDVMETFDDARTAATIDLLAEMAAHGQVIYLTHHRHLCDIAAERCPDALIHTLSV